MRAELQMGPAARPAGVSRSPASLGRAGVAAGATRATNEGALFSTASLKIASEFEFEAILRLIKGGGRGNSPQNAGRIADGPGGRAPSRRDEQGPQASMQAAGPRGLVAPGPAGARRGCSRARVFRHALCRIDIDQNCILLFYMKISTVY